MEEPIYRVYDRRFGPLGFNPSASSARFRPIQASDGSVVPTAYGAADAETALAETLLRGVDALAQGKPRQLLLDEVQGKELATLVPRRELQLARFRGQALHRYGLLREDVIECEAARYPYTAEWSQAVYDCPVALMGIAWTSRQSDADRAVILWEGALEPSRDLRLDDAPIALDAEPGLELVREACAYARFIFEG
jgi:hypothetical protein